MAEINTDWLYSEKLAFKFGAGQPPTTFAEEQDRDRSIFLRARPDIVQRLRKAYEDAERAIPAWLSDYPSLPQEEVLLPTAPTTEPSPVVPQEDVTGRPDMGGLSQPSVTTQEEVPSEVTAPTPGPGGVAPRMPIAPVDPAVGRQRPAALQSPMQEPFTPTPHAPGQVPSLPVDQQQPQMGFVPSDGGVYEDSPMPVGPGVEPGIRMEEYKPGKERPLTSPRPGRRSDAWLAAKGSGSRRNPDPATKDMQNKLSQLGYDIGVDGIFGGGTEKTLEQFQLEHDLPMTGRLTPDTLAVMDGLLAEEKRKEDIDAYNAVPEGRRARRDFLAANVEDMGEVVKLTGKGYKQDSTELPQSIFRDEYGRVSSNSDKSSQTKVTTTNTGGTIFDLTEWTDTVGGGIPGWSNLRKIKPDAIILHETGDIYNEGGEAEHFANSFMGKTSPTAHYFVDKNGKVFLFLPEDREGQHAVGWNSRSIGIEVEGIGSGKEEHKPNAAQLEATHKLVQYLKEKYDIVDDNILAHEETERRRGETGRRTDGTIYRDDVLVALKGSGAVDWTGRPIEDGVDGVRDTDMVATQSQKNPVSTTPTQQPGTESTFEPDFDAKEFFVSR